MYTYELDRFLRPTLRLFFWNFHPLYIQLQSALSRYNCYLFVSFS